MKLSATDSIWLAQMLTAENGSTVQELSKVQYPVWSSIGCRQTPAIMLLVTVAKSEYLSRSRAPL